MTPRDRIPESPCPHRVDVTVHRDGRVTCNRCQEVIGRVPRGEALPETEARYAYGDR